MPKTAFEESVVTNFLTESLTVDLSNAIKKEVVTTGEHVFHRKSTRRRVARDIFLVFEKHPNRRRGHGSNRRKTRLKAKFGHLKANDTNLAENLLSDIKTSPKCYLNNTCRINEQNRQVQKVPLNKANTSAHHHNISSYNGSIPRVNPIFLWAKQDDTRIIEVRCEDYDKRNRIRLTKTTNGWRAIPHSDTSSTRIVKLFQTPVFKIKREVYGNQIYNKTNETNSKIDFVSKAEEMTQKNKMSNIIKNDLQLVNCTSTLSDTLVKQMESQKPMQKQIKEGIRRGTLNNLNVRNCNVGHQEKSTQNEAVNCGVINNGEENGAKPICVYKPYGGASGCTGVANEFVIGSRTCEQEYKEINMRAYQHHLSELQLCPKTNIFLPRSGANTTDNVREISMDTRILVNLVNCEIHCNDKQSQSLDSNTKNLKDLLDDADLLQHCSDHPNSDSDIIDSLVISSCENNLIREADIVKEELLPSMFSTSGKSCYLPKNTIEDIIPNTIDAISEAPRSLSFNEAGEIEGLNGELFQSNNSIDTFDREIINGVEFDPKTNILQPDLNIATINEKTCVNMNFVDTPSDLSFKKSVVGPLSVSQNQCKVLSSLDDIKSPILNDIPAVESASETLRNLILEQIIKLNNLNASGRNQSEPVNLENQRNLNTSDACDYTITSKFINTVVIDDSSVDEPIKKRLRNIDSVNAKDKKCSVSDEDPDPLTQLRLLMRNTEWKVPDPILVPKDRLSAVLASPAREIPLLITTRPELRLPEAFAYPEIIQNPNILVISLAQLEAILKNDVSVEKSKHHTLGSGFHMEKRRKIKQQQRANTIHNVVKNLQHSDSKAINSKLTQIDSSLASDLNPTTFAVLNQMLWLPFFGQLSQECLNTMREPVDIQNKCNTALPLNDLYQYGPQSLDELYKKYIKHIYLMKQVKLGSSIQTNSNSDYMTAMETLRNPMDIAVFQKILQQQMQSFVTLSSQNAKNESVTNQTSLNTNFDATQAMENSTSIATFMVNDRKTNTNITDISRLSNLITNSVDSITDTNSETKAFSGIQNSVIDNKPRLTCKSLSNLLEPKNINENSSPSLDHFSSNDILNIQESGGAIPKRSVINKHFNSFQTTESTLKPDRHAKIDCLIQQRKPKISLPEINMDNALLRNSHNLYPDKSQTLWHPLFGSNTKTSYSSPWQWTTVTATGE